MIIKKFEIKGLHGEYDYSIEFYEDVTFLYGANGSGKTTVLNLLTYVITCRFYKLIDYTFSTLILTYIGGNKVKTLTIKMERKDISKKNNIEIITEDDKIIIDNIDKILRNIEMDDIGATFEDLYPSIKPLKNEFHYICLPLNRLAATENIEEVITPFRRRRYIANSEYSFAYLNESLKVIEKLIQDSCMKINITENFINNQFRKQVLSSATRISKDTPIEQIISDLEKIDLKKVMKSKEAYIKTLQELDIYDQTLEENIEEFYTEFEKEYNKYQLNKNTIRINFAFLYNDYLRIQQVVGFAKENEKAKEKNRQRKDLFVRIINDFFITSGTDKKIEINKEGLVKFNTNTRILTLNDLSSGEKQLIITFASFIFGMKNETKGVYIVDEPEASLHLEWQSKFVNALLSANKKIQLIFATHSPELIGEYSSKAIELKHN